MINEFKAMNEQVRELNKHDFIMPEALETGIRVFVQTCIKYRLNLDNSSDFIEQLLDGKMVTLTNISGVKQKVFTAIAREELVKHAREVKSRADGCMNELNREQVEY